MEQKQATFGQAGWALLIAVVILFVWDLVGPYAMPDSTVGRYLVLALIELTFLIPPLVLWVRGHAPFAAHFAGNRAVVDVLLGLAMGLVMVPVAGLLNVLAQAAILATGGHPLGGGLPALPGYWGLALGVTSVALSAAVSEEALFRGLLLPTLGARQGLARAVLLSAALFALCHGNLATLPYTFAQGVMLAALAVRTGSLWASMGYHFATNALSVVVQFGVEGLSRDPELGRLFDAAASQADSAADMLRTALTMLPMVVMAAGAAALLYFLLTRAHPRRAWTLARTGEEVSWQAQTPYVLAVALLVVLLVRSGLMTYFPELWR